MPAIERRPLRAQIAANRRVLRPQVLDRVALRARRLAGHKVHQELKRSPPARGRGRETGEQAARVERAHPALTRNA
jgi:hypothetical protein